MTRVVKPSWVLFDRLVAEAKEELLICAPWMSFIGLQRLERLLLDTSPPKKLRCVQLWARVADINTDSPSILALVRRLELTGISTVVRDSPILHAKIYKADRALAIVTSANLSEGGFSENLEAAVIVNEPADIKQVSLLLSDIEKQTTLVSIADLEHFITQQRPLIKQERPPEISAEPVWRQPLAKEIKKEGPPYSVDFCAFMDTVTASIASATEELQQINLEDWIGRKVVVWVCPCQAVGDLSPYWMGGRLRPFSDGELKIGDRMLPERFTMLEGVIEGHIENDRVIFRKKRSHKAGILLTRFPDRGVDNPLRPSGFDPYFLLNIAVP